ncbi:MAG: protein translocase subunit SecF [Thermovirgaceae bacterium]
MFIKKRDWKIDFMRIRRKALLLSAVLLLASLGLLVTRGLNLGIDFNGGHLVQAEFSEPVEVADVRSLLAGIGQEQAVIQGYGDNGMIVRLKSSTDDTQVENVIDTLRESYSGMEVLRLEKVGPVVGETLRRQAVIAVIIALAGILLYITVRFRFRFAVSSVLALLHDAIITLGVFSLTGREITLPFIAAILTIVGYSLNDTIVVLDRVRENWRGLRKEGILPLINRSINQTLSRTLNTSLTTFLPVLALFLWGGPVIANFAFALMVGIIVGTYSSIYVSGTIIGEWYLRAPEGK